MITSIELHDAHVLINYLILIKGLDTRLLADLLKLDYFKRLQNQSVALIRLHIQVVGDCPNTEPSQVSSVHGKGDGRFSAGLQTIHAQLLPSSDFLQARLHPTPSSRLWGLVAIGGKGGGGILVFPNCCLYQVLSLRSASKSHPLMDVSS